jgi:hypothetical protein
MIDDSYPIPEMLSYEFCHYCLRENSKFSDRETHNHQNLGKNGKNFNSGYIPGVKFPLHFLGVMLDIF